MGDDGELFDAGLTLAGVTWTDGVVDGPVRVQCSAHGASQPARIAVDDANPTVVDVRWEQAQRRVAPGQSVVFYDAADRRVLGGGVATRR